MKLIKAGCIIDFYVSKKKYNSFKRENTKKSYVEQVLKEYLQSLVGTTKNGTEIRYCDITSNGFWGENLLFINDLNYSYSNEIEPRTDDKLAIRVFQIDLIGIKVADCNKFKDIIEENFILSFSSVLSF